MFPSHDPASSTFANEYVGATEFYTPTDDGLNDKEWHGKVYCFPPSQPYFWDKKQDRWKVTRGLSPTLTSGHALWFRTMKRKWLAGEFEQGIYFTNYVDCIMYNQDMFDFPMCIMKSRPKLIRHYYADDSIEKKNTGVCLIVYMQPLDRVAEATEEFVEIYSEKGRILV